MSTRKDKFSKKDINYMRLALNLARARHGLTGENPSVGCVIVKNDHIISIGQTGYSGRPHAEYNAMKNSIEDLKGSKMYVSLEPCSHYGQTPPCTKEIIKKKIKEVVYSVEDVDKKVKGKTFKILKSKNIQVKKGLLKNEISNFYNPYFFNRKNKQPYVTGKIAISKNNLIYSKGTKKITDIHSDKLTHFLRYKNDSILISYKTLNEDNPKLNCRL
ncbi:bifunctional diaminohydroxyphosphoribosylaminopyrimidine deaminase/5-amino-6-(5-phosphoribosylamino)uracil reductase RibD, partial [Candidatus Pelagibacter bacterium]|nr:bifunctional diaminohydroxyphosphoribosylaminopyrimidine deaminase/5-amino-6-(5-phosphoribosylamino)uracil reductase RibD [Candidatus Pelagibacter bacterium]